MARPLGAARGQLETGTAQRSGKTASFGTGLGQWKPSSSPSFPLAFHAVAPVTPSAPLVAPHVVVNATSAGFEQSAQHIDRFKWFGAAALAMSQRILCHASYSSISSERPVLYGDPSLWCRHGRQPPRRHSPQLPGNAGKWDPISRSHSAIFFRFLRAWETSISRRCRMGQPRLSLRPHRGHWSCIAPFTYGAWWPPQTLPLLRTGVLWCKHWNNQRECPSANMHNLEKTLVGFGTCKGQRTSAKQSDGGNPSVRPAFKWRAPSIGRSF